MLRKLLLSVVIVLFANVMVFAQSAGALKGTLKDAGTGDPIPFANIVVESGGQQVTGATTDFDGNYTIKPLSAGRYDVKATYVGYKTRMVTGVIISPNKTTYQNMDLTSSMQQLDVVEIVSYKVPLISKDQTQSGGTVTSEEIAKMPGRDAGSIASTVSGVQKQDGSEDLNIRGSRAEATVMYIDGVRVRGSSNVPKSAVDQVNVITGGLPAKYGDATGGVINITTKGPSREFGGGVELVTSEFLDDFGYNLAAFSLRGPLLTKKLENRTASVVGFFLAGEAKYINDDRPFHDGYWKATDAFMNEILATPLLERSGGGTNLYAEDNAYKNRFEKNYKKENNLEQAFNVSSKIDIKPPEANFNITLGGSIDFSDKQIYNIRNSLFNSENNSQYIESTWRGYARFTQRFNDGNTGAEEKTSLVKNIYYSIQADYSRTASTWQDASNKDDFFGFGHVGKFESFRSRNYTQEADYNNWIYTAYQYNDSLQEWEGIDSLYVQNYYEFTGYRSDSVYFTPSEVNDFAAYTTEFYNIFGNGSMETRSLDDIQGNGGLLNGDAPAGIYGLFNSYGTNFDFYRVTEADQFSISAEGSADIGNHALEFGMRYEQRTDRVFAVNSPSSLWTLMRQLSNRHVYQIDILNPIVRYEDMDGDGVNDTIIDYNQLYTPSNQSTFDKNMRAKLGLPVNSDTYVDVDNFDPSMYSLDMFSADELLNDGRSYVSYYGYDHTGVKKTDKPSFEDFFTETDENGDFTRPIAPYQPIYMAGYVQDKFEFNDLIFRLGFRVDRFDANQFVLKDPYLLYNAYTIGEKRNSIGTDIAVVHPENLGDDAVIYVNDEKNPSAIVAYREGDVWYNAEGTELTDVVTIKDMNPKPYLIDPSQAEEYPTAEAFEDYKPQNSFMPRVAFSFPVSDEANFYAHYDVITQRPTQNNRMDITNFYYLEQRATANNFFANPNLKPEKTINYQLGFQQKISNTSAIRIESYVKDLRDLQQSHYFIGAYPKPYYSYENKDFGTVKGFMFGYDLRRTGNVWLKANYTLQFAEGTGSDENTSANLIRANQPNLRTILPLNYDSRHSVNIIFDFRYSEGKDYNGPVAGNAQILKNTGVNMTVQANSGNPYSKSSTIRSIWTGQGQSVLEGSINGSRMPWRYTVNAKIDRDITLNFGNDEKKKEAYLNVYFEILNVLNTKNVQRVYDGTGDPEDDGYLNSASAQIHINGQTNPQVFRDLYYMRMSNPYYFGFPRRIRFGLAFNF